MTLGKKEVNQIYDKGFDIELYEHVGLENNPEDFILRKFIGINRENFNPVDFKIDYHKDGYDGVMSFSIIPYNNMLSPISGKQVAVTLYNNNGKTDCSKISLEFNDKGYKEVSAFNMTLDNFVKLLNNKYYDR